MRKMMLALMAMMVCLSAGAATGDVNGDGEVNISDVNSLIELILSDETSDSGDVNGDGEITISDVNALIEIILNGSDDEEPVEVTPKDIELDYSTLTEASETIPDDEDAADYNDYVENTSWSTTVRITLDGDTATVTGNPSSVIVTTDGAHVTITSAAKKVRYIVTGSTTNGSLKFYGEKKFQLQLNGVDITNPNGAAINNQCGKSFYLVPVAGTTNTLRDGETYTMVGDEDQRATIFSEGQILLSGSGELNVYSVGKNCMASDDFIFVRPGTRLYLNSTSGHGMKAKDYVYIKGGVINMELSADGSKGINCDSLVTITGGRTTIINSGTTAYETDTTTNVTDTTACAGVKADYNMTMTGGTLNIKCTGNDAKCINVAQPFVFSGGELNAVATGSKTNVKPKGVKCDSDCTISGGSFYSCAPEGHALDVDGTFTVADGYTTYTTTDERLIEIVY